jgi:hypothetical protein
MISTIDIAWLGGLLEGEGSFNWTSSPHIQIQSTDFDVVQHAGDLLGVIPQAEWRPKGKPSYKPVRGAHLHGARAAAWMMTIYPFMGERRQAKIREVLIRWNNAPDMPRAPRGQRWMATCHPDKPRSGNGLCNSCHMRQWRAKRNADIVAGIPIKKGTPRPRIYGAPTCHPDRPHASGGLCASCYVKAWRAKKVKKI